MKFTINSGAFTDTITAAISSVPAKPTIPVMGGVLVEAQIGAVTFSSFNFDRATSRTVSADVVDTDLAVVSGRLLATVGGHLPKGADVVVTVDSSEMEIRCGRTKFRLPLMIADDYPQLPTMEQGDVIGSVDRDVFAEAVRAIGGFASTDQLTELTKMLAALNLSTADGCLTLRGTDRYIAARRRIAWSGGTADDLDINVAAADILSVIKAVDGTGDVELLCNRSLFGIRTSLTTVTTRLLGEDFPNFNRQIAVETHNATATVPTAVLASMLKRVVAISDDVITRVDVILADGTLAVVAAGDSSGGIDDDVDVIHHGKDHRLTLSAKRLLNALAAIDDDHVTLAFQATGYLVHIYPGEVEPSLDGDLRPPATDTVAMLVGIRSA